MSSKSTWTGLIDELRERRLTRAHRRDLERELAAYTTPNEIEDLLASLEREEGPDAELVRAVLGSHLVERYHHAAMSA